MGTTPVFQRVARLSLLHAHLPAALLAAAMTLVCLSGLHLGREVLDAQHQVRRFAGDYLTSPTFWYQALLFSVCPLLPLVAVIDDIETELAWALFLAPLCAVYYLALLSLSLQQRTDQLQSTIEALGASRQRQAELQDYAALITQAQEDERRRLARELHDDTAQALVALARGLDTLSVGKAAEARRSGSSGSAGDLNDSGVRISPQR